MCMLIPALLVQRQHPVTDELIVRQPKPAPAPPMQEAVPREPLVHVYLTGEQAVEKVTLEQYVRGVVAAEMPTEFEMEALKAQAIAARTFIVRRLAHHDTSGVPVKGAEVTDTVAHQVYMSIDNLTNPKNKEKLARVTQAVNETRGMILTYKGEPIEASFFSTSNGYTENSEDYWTNRIPYLRSVASPWDESIAPHFMDTVSMPLTQFMNLLNISPPAIPASASVVKKQQVLANAAEPRILSTTTGHRIKLIRIRGKNYSGREIREKLGLRSSEFTWRIHKGQIDITTYGNGHGVGMSQWGANGMAKEGATAEAIVKHYYTGVSLEQVNDVLKLE
ncbi:stage II sporulation protein D [Paenibacillus selenitireducens]|uniref:Stage II sporulation protein D n=1 Tax=Paenibacillus selenitireducens TaxID=1324314 RepID=A0A1T2X7F5_9BACL|nr:stage II sporulation protein D [Paenibacillus selenitireducens]